MDIRERNARHHHRTPSASSEPAEVSRPEAAAKRAAGANQRAQMAVRGVNLCAYHVGKGVWTGGHADDEKQMCTLVRACCSTGFPLASIAAVHFCHRAGGCPESRPVPVTGVYQRSIACILVGGFLGQAYRMRHGSAGADQTLLLAGRGLLLLPLHIPDRGPRLA